MSIIKFYADYQFCLGGAWWKYIKRLSLSHKTLMLFIMSIAMIIRMPEAYAVTVRSTTAYHAAVVVAPANIVSLMKGKKPISIPENEVITSVDTEDYLEENSDEDYDDMMKKDNLTGEFQKLRINAQLLTQPVARSRTACRRKM